MKNRYSDTGRIFFPVFLAATGLLFFSCTQFFSTSWAPWAARDPDKLIPPVTTGNVDQLISIYENDPDGSLALLKKIRDAHKGSSPVLEAAALKAAVNSIGLVGAVAEVLGDFSNEINSADTKKIFESTLEKMPNLGAASAALSEILPRDGAAWDNFVETASANDLAMGAVVILLGEASGNVDFSDPDAFKDFANNMSNPNIKLARDMVDASIKKTDDTSTDDGLSEMLKDILKNLDLWK